MIFPEVEATKIKSRGVSDFRVAWGWYNIPKAPLERSKLIFAEIEGLDSIHKVQSRKKIMLLAN